LLDQALRQVGRTRPVGSVDLQPRAWFNADLESRNYTTDYRSEGYKQSAKSDSAPAKASGGDAKPAAKTESKPAKPPPKT
jgi:hypothetical protein